MSDLLEEPEKEIPLAAPFDDSGKIIVSNSEFADTLRYLKAEGRKVGQVKVLKNSHYEIFYFTPQKTTPELL